MQHNDNTQEYILVDKKALRQWRIIGVIVYVGWFFFGGEIIEGFDFSYQGMALITYVMSYAIPYAFLKYFLYRHIYFKKLYGTEWSEELEKKILGK